jgi:intron-binding protein aquarius
MDGFNRLKRWIMIGDHHQLPPVIKNMAFQKYSNMEQSLFTRLVRLGVPTVDLDGQGRARSSICALYKWRYKKLDDLQHILSWNEYKTANAGFAFDYQLINVENFNGIGESEPNPFFYQNLGEAEYVVAVYMYMRLIGYPAEKISILTTYNGQKHLIRDVINSRCTDNPLIGRPHKVTTVDKYQGQQNDYVLISLVRTKAVGHLRDVRRLVVAASRARLGLYIFGRVSLFKNCFELQPTFKLLTQRPQELHLIEDENFPTTRTVQDPVKKPLVMPNMPKMAEYVYKIYMTKFEAMKEEIENMRKLYEEMPKEVPQKPDEKMEVEEEPQETVEFVPIPIQNEIDEEILAAAEKSRKKMKKNDDENEGVQEEGSVEKISDDPEKIENPGPDEKEKDIEIVEEKPDEPTVEPENSVPETETEAGNKNEEDAEMADSK